MTKMVTRCPQCGTSFRITAAQLQTARGAVRCGACLHIFRGQEHLVGDTKPATQASSALVRKPAPKTTTTTKPAERDASPAKTTAPAASSHQTLNFDQSLIDAESGALDDDDFLISDDMDKAEDEEDDLLDVSTPRTSSLFEREIRIPDEEPQDSTDESWAMSLLAEEDEKDEVAVTPAAGKKTTEDTFEQDLESAYTPTEDQGTTAPPKQPAPESRIHFQLEEPSRDTEQHYSGERMQAYDSGRSALLMGIDPEPVEMAWTPSSNKRRKLLWAGLALLGGLVLVAQIAWLQFERLSRLEPYRGFYAVVCPFLGCELPVLRDPSQIRAANLVVRSHPDVDGALSVDAILLNNAPFEQPFPDLVLEFSNLEGEIVAERRFTPEEYLSGELSGRTLIPRNQPVHLTLELVDPGLEAVNYRAYIPE
ncbi:DUF3426 domain-containing protein [Marinimicrobium sp. ABcell2]|uniref:DUF3426 domain-containing protein n=1 Tax=Marinimicrobium sp. ABcell2 TaxID=3069751 RepID=UPI0027B2A6A0|nr:DUF3426 domain-containing protein [Marinimicrobium sp. ABcell2]MDQ2078236.1 DUF3426 domain-containing protein [Marinimicrobium sp. ABcell2]